MTDKTGKEDLVWELAETIAEVQYNDLPPETVAATKKSILDTLGVIEAASGMTPHEQMGRGTPSNAALSDCSQPLPPRCRRT